jgi:3-oxoacyl-[acyl-carrier-protein] synthase III
LIPHQANIRIIESTINRLKMPAEKVIINIQNYGNTSSTSIPIAINENRRAGKKSAAVICAYVSALVAGLRGADQSFVFDRQLL